MGVKGARLKIDEGMIQSATVPILNEQILT